MMGYIPCFLVHIDKSQRRVRYPLEEGRRVAGEFSSAGVRFAQIRLSPG